MIRTMTKYSFILLDGDKELFLQELQELGVVDIVRSSQPVDETSAAILSEIESVKHRIRCIENGSDSGLVAIQDKISSLRKELDGISVWGDYDKSMLSLLDIKLYSVSRKLYDCSWEDKYAIQVIEEDKEHVYFVIAGDAADFPVASLPVPDRTAKEVEEEIAQMEKCEEAHKAGLESERANIPQMEEKLRTMENELSLYLARCTARPAAEEKLAIFTGFAPTEDKNRLSEAFDKMPAYWTSEEATLEDNPPIALRNNKFVRQFETLTEMYGMPAYNEFDPTVFLSIFFLLFFSICMGDAGYGILLTAIGLFLKGKDGGLAKMWSLVTTLGIGTIVVGVLLGGFFGINLPAQEWLPEPLRNYWAFMGGNLPGTTYSVQMVLSLAIGIIHICLALIMKAVWAVRKNGFMGSLSDLGWTLLVVGGIVGLGIGLTGVISETAMKWLLIGIAAVSALGIYLFNNPKRNPLVNVGAGLWDTYNMASGLMGDVLSYIRLYALGLSGAMLAQTFNSIAEMVKGADPTWQWVPFVLILLVGHVLNLAMCCLGAFVHPLRLNFVEFFKNSGYEGIGKKYNPIRKL